MPSRDLTAWFQVGWSTDFPPDEVRSLRYFGEDLVAFRDRQGTLHVLDAHCQHIGAHLGVGGCVTEQGIRCPFHGWVWDGDGRNVEIPYQSTPNRARRMRTWPTVERNGAVFVWCSPSGSSPTWDLPEALADACPALEGREFHPLAREHFRDLRIHPQFVIENAVDPAHFPAVHGTRMMPNILHEDVQEHTWYAEAGFGAGWEGKRVVDRPYASSLTICFSGIGVSYNMLLNDGLAAVVLVATTCVDDTISELFETAWVEATPDDDEESVAARIAFAMGPLAQDLAIWNSQRYVDPAGLATSEVRGFNRMRRWTRRFYTDPATGPVTSDEVDGDRDGASARDVSVLPGD